MPRVQRLPQVDPDVGDRGEALLVEVDIGVEGREGADGEAVPPRAGDDLPHAVAQHEHVARLGVSQ